MCQCIINCKKNIFLCYGEWCTVKLHVPCCTYHTKTKWNFKLAIHIQNTVRQTDKAWKLYHRVCNNSISNWNLEKNSIYIYGREFTPVLSHFSVVFCPQLGKSCCVKYPFMWSNITNVYTVKPHQFELTEWRGCLN